MVPPTAHAYTSSRFVLDPLPPLTINFIYISFHHQQIFDNTAAAKDGTLQSGDELIGVDGVSVKGKSKSEVASLVETCRVFDASKSCTGDVDFALRATQAAGLFTVLLSNSLRRLNDLIASWPCEHSPINTINEASRFIRRQ